MEQIIYVIEKGNYSDRHVCAVTLSKEHAEWLKNLLKREDGGYDAASVTVTEYVPDELSKRGYRFQVLVRRNDGLVWDVAVDDYESFDDKAPDDRIVVYETYSEDGEPVLEGDVAAPNEKHACKIAKDEWAAWKARQEGV